MGTRQKCSRGRPRQLRSDRVSEEVKLLRISDEEGRSGDDDEHTRPELSEKNK